MPTPRDAARAYAERQAIQARKLERADAMRARIAARQENANDPIVWTEYRESRRDADRERLREKDRKRSVGYRLFLNNGIPYFVGWDGEGMNIQQEDGTTEHRYTLIANSERAYLENESGLSTEDIFDFLLEQSRTISASERVLTHVMYGMGYDVNMWLRDLDRESLRTLYATTHVIWRDYSISWTPRHTITIKHKKRKITLWEVMGYWQKSFVAACRAHHILDEEQEQTMQLWKNQRSGFTREQREQIREYCLSETIALRTLTTQLAQNIEKLKLQSHRWDGAGAIAARLLRRHNMQAHNSRRGPPEASSAYFGGRIELLRYGHTTAPIYEYDLTSAYPYATTLLPCLAHGDWYTLTRDEVDALEPRDVALIHVQFAAPGYENVDPLPFGGVLRAIPGDVRARDPHFCPIPHRDRNGYVRFPVRTTTWVYLPEYLFARNWLRIHGGSMDVIDAMVFRQSCNCECGAWMQAVFNERAARKKAGDATEYVLKLGMNACYGKFAQRHGHASRRRPPFHNLVWAGYITSVTRAAIGSLALNRPNDILAFATDAVYSLTALEVPDSAAQLGGWKEQVHCHGGVFVQPGVYWLRGADGWAVRHTRGFSIGDLTPEQIIQHWERGESHAVYQRTRFTSLGMVIHADNDESWKRWANWDKYERQLQLDPVERKRDPMVMIYPTRVRPARKLVQTRPYRLAPDDEISQSSNVQDVEFDAERTEGQSTEEAFA